MALVDVLGVAMDLVDHPGSQTAMRDCRQIAMGEYCLAGLPLRPGDVIVDVGANVGVVSVLLAKRRPDVKVFAYEPVPATFRLLTENIARNGVFNVMPFNLAVNCDGKPVDIHFDPVNPGGSSAEMVSHRAVEPVRCQAITLADIFEQTGAPRCRLLKIDCEGGEYEILTPSLLKRVDYLVGEFHGSPQFDAKGRSPQKLLAKVGKSIPLNRVSVTGLRMQTGPEGTKYSNLGDMARKTGPFRADV